MSTRNLNPHQMFIDMAASHRPRHRFDDAAAADFGAWKRRAQSEVIACLGDFPARVPANPELVAEWRDRGLRTQRWLIDVQPHLAAALLVNYPEDLRAGERRPAILCWHGHGAHGKEPVMGNASSPALAESIRSHNYDYGYQMARAGYVTFAIDWMGAGERHPEHKPNRSAPASGRDWCNILYLHATMFGTTSLALNVAHGRAATDFVCTLPEVDAQRLGVMGLSGGGTMTTWSYLCDERFGAAEIVCYCDLWAAFGLRDNNYCGMQVAPGLYKLVDLPDLQGLLAPRPLLVDIGARDTCFTIDTALPAYRRLEAIYRAAGAADKLELDLHPREHGWGGNRSVEFFRRHLGQ